MDALKQRIEEEAQYLGNGIVKVDGFLNHQVDPVLTQAMGHAFAERFTAVGVHGITRIVTAETSGIAPAVATGMALGVPVVYARKSRPITMPDGFFKASAPSHTKGVMVDLMISPEFLNANDHVLIIDDFLARGLTLAALVDVVNQSGATLCGIGCVIEKQYEGGRAHIANTNVPIISLAQIDLKNDKLIVT